MGHMEFRERLLVSLYNAIRIAYNGETINACPHCGEGIISPIYPLYPIVICTCGYCEQYVIPFAGLLLPIAKDVVDRGEETDLRHAIIQAIMKCLHAGVKSMVGQSILVDENTVAQLMDQIRIQANENVLPTIPDSIDDLEDFWNKEEGGSEEEPK